MARILWGAGIAWVLTAAQICAAQEPTLKTRPPEQRERQYLAGRRITLNVQVYDAAGKPIGDLDAKDFVLLDNHQPRKIAAFHEIDGQSMNDATEVVVVLDAVNSTAQELDAERNGIFNYLAKSKGPLPYPMSFVLWFNGHLKATAATTDRNAVGRAFVSMTKGVHSNACSPVDNSVAQAVEGGGPGALQQGGIGSHAVGVANCLEVHFKDSVAAMDGIAQQQKTRGGRTILIWVGPGWPLLSDVEFQRMTPKAKQSLFEEIVTVMGDLRESQVTVDTVSPRDGTREAEMARVDLLTLAAGLASPQSAVPSNLALQVVARQTGGRLLNESRDITADLESCMRDAEDYYMVTFEMMPTAVPHEFHPLEVRVNRPGLEVRTMSAYYAEPQNQAETR